MSDIEFKKGEVCRADGKNWLVWEESQGTVICDKNHTIKSMAALVGYKDFQLNEIREGDFIPASELDTEKKYNDVVEVFGLFGFKPCSSHSKYIGMVNYWKGVEIYNGEVANTNSTDGRQLTHSQVIAIGKLKRMMLERERGKGGYIDDVPDNTSEFDAIVSGRSVGKVNKEFNESDIERVLSNADIYSAENFPKIDLEEKPKRRNKSKQAYDILKSLDYEYDLVKQKWYKKQYID